MTNPKKNATKYKSEQDQYWRQLKDELLKFRDDCGASMAELADGLNISRQRLYDFINQEDKGLPIQRSDLVSLWDYLTNPNEFSGKKISSTAKEKRTGLRKEGPDELLIAAGFLPQSSSRSLDRRSLDLKNPQIRRVLTRLSSNWIEDDLARSYLANNMLDQILDRGRLDRDSYINLISEKEAEDWPEQGPLRSNDKRVLKKYKKAIRKLASSGKTEFVKAELFELYQSILEHDILKTDTQEKLQVTDCQFRTLSIPIHDLDEEIKSVCKTAEEELIKLLYKASEEANEGELDSRFLFTPVTEAAIGCDFVRDGIVEASLSWCYSSTATHLENMLNAIQKGLGYPLIMTSFSVRATGRNAKSLARVSIALYDENDPNKTYQGWWVGSNTILSILKSVVDALRGWITDQLIDFSYYYEVCRKLAEFDELLSNSKGLIYEHAPDYRNSKKVNEVIEKSLSVRKFLESSNLSSQYPYEKHFKELEVNCSMGRLMKMYATLIFGDLSQAEEFLKEAEEILEEAKSGETLQNTQVNDTKYQKSQLLALHASVCVMLYNLLVGDKEFLVGKLWRHRSRYRLTTNLERLGRYVKQIGTIDFDIYLCASQIYGTTGYLEFYSAQAADASNLKESIKNLLSAAHYSSRIGHIRRTAYWLAYASRACCRLGDVDRAKKLSHIADKILSDSRKSSEAVESWSRTNILLSHGERCLLTENFEEALSYFLKSLKESIYIGFPRFVADSLYNISRASLGINTSIDKCEIDNPFSELDETDEIWKNNKSTQILLPLLKRLLVENVPVSSLSDEFKDEAQSTWHSWTQFKEGTDAARHPFGEEIASSGFLAVLK